MDIHTTMEENKRVDTSFDDTDVLDVWKAVLLNGVATGDDATNRQGRSIELADFGYSGFLRSPSGGGIPTGYRIIFVIDHQNNSVDSTSGSGPTDLATALLADQSIVYSLYNPDYVGRFSVLDDILGFKPATPENPNNFKTLQENMALEGWATLFSGTGSTGADISAGALYCLYRCEASGTGTGIRLQLYSRVTFGDM